MDRRTMVVGLVAGSLAGPRRSSAQGARRPARVGFLALGATADLAGPRPVSPQATALLHGLRELGYTYGEQLVTEPRGSEGRPERFPDLVAELLRARVDVVVATNAPLPALKRATSTVPVVMTAAIDPVGEGQVRSLSRPGGNMRRRA